MHATSPSFQTITFIAVLKATRHLFARGAAHVTVYATHIVNLFFPSPLLSLFPSRFALIVQNFKKKILFTDISTSIPVFYF
jgi:hypothetical protein